MNIFFLDTDPKLCAQYHNDKHVVKMILEYAQLMCTAHRVLDPNSDHSGLYSITHINHPCAVWVRESSENYKQLYTLWVQLCKEYTYRYCKEHATEEKLKSLLRKLPRNISRVPATTPPKCMPVEYHKDCVVESYRAYYIGAKSQLASWRFRNKPEWFTGGK